MKNKKNLIRRIIFFSTIGLLIVSSIVFVIAITQVKVVAQNFFPYTASYESDQDVISSSSVTNNYVTMTKANTDGSVEAGKVISISTPQEFKLFSDRCESTSQFLSYSYELMTDIDFSNSGLSITPIGYNTPFSGSFNGNGYSLLNLPFINVTTQINTEYQFTENSTKPIQYFALFSKNSGTITNLGVVNPRITVSYVPSGNGLAYVAPFVGLNTGTIHHSYTKENRSRDLNNTGIYTLGGFYISGFASINNGTIHDVYTSRSILSTSNSQGVIAQAELLNDGTAPTASYFYDSTITSYTGTPGGICTILYNSNYVAQNILNVTHFGNYAPSMRQLTLDVVTNDTETTKKSVGSWYNLTSYSTQAQNYFKDSDGDFIYGTPISRGIVTENNLTFVISNNREFSYMYELFALNKNFATSVATFKITQDIDMSAIYAPKYYTSDIGCNIVGAKNNTVDTPVTIYNTPIKEYYSKTLGIDCFGVFPWLTGSVSYINVVLGTSSNAYNFTFDRSEDTNKLAFGAISGYVDGGTIENCNVYINISFDNAIGKYYFGGIAGMIGSSSISTGKVKESTVNGSINQTNTSVGTITETVNYLDGMVLGGAVGYLDYTTGTVDEVLSKVNITSTGVTNKAFSIGGVVGAGYSYKLNKLQYQATMNLSSSSITYSSLYASGIIGRLLGVKQQADYLTNYGNITLYQKTNTESYISGIMNVDIITPTSQGGYTPVSNNPLESQGAYYFYGASFTNKSDITISNISTNLSYTEVVNVKSSNGFTTKLSGLYNSETSNDIAIDIYKISSFAPILNNIGGNTSYKVDLQTAYNFKNVVLTTSNNITANSMYAGVAIGEYINYKNIHNLGNITTTISNQYGTNNSRKNLIISGVFNEVSSGCTSDMIYNAGNISINYTANVYGNIYASGICYANRNGFNDIEIQSFDPASDKHQSDAIGSINSAINNGQIEVTNPAYANIAYSTYVDVLSANGAVTTERHYYNNDIHPSACLYGDTNVSGIVNYNYSVITNTFNIADLFAANYIRDSQRNEINVSGLVTYNIGKYAVIENSANDGTIKAINLSFYMVFDNGKTKVNKTYAEYAFVNASGIVCHNDKTDSGAIYDNGGTHSKQIIAFTINYGSIYSYNVARNSTSSASESFRTVSAGILGTGLLNLVNVVNYGNVYGSEVSGGILGVMFFNCFNTEVNTNNRVSLANTINYAKVLVIDKGELAFRENSNYQPQSYSSFRVLTNSSTCYYVSLDVYAKDYFNGSVFGIINFAGSSNAANVITRYVISFNEDVRLVGAESQTPSVVVDLSTFYSAYLDFDGGYTLDTYIGQPVVYSPLSTGTEKINGITYYGVFNEKFSFRQAVSGNEDYLDVENYSTDSFISDYFEFVGATYVNSYLLNTIGWGTIAYNAAAESFATSLDGVSKFVKYLGEHSASQYTSLTNAALQTDTWLSKCDEDVLLGVVEELIKNENSSELLAVIQFVFSSSSKSFSIIDSRTRVRLLELLIENDDTIDYSLLLESLIVYSNGYASLLADAVLTDNDASEYLYDYIKSLSQNSVRNILKTYCDYLDSNANNSYFSYSNNSQVRYDILSAVFSEINSTAFYQKLAESLNITTDVSLYNMSDEIAMYTGLTQLDDNQRVSLYKAIILSSVSDMKTYINGMSTEVDYYLRLINDGYTKTSLNGIYNDIISNSTSSVTSVIDERVELWNQIRNTEVFKSYIDNRIPNEYIALATEVNNTYQTTTVPVPEAKASHGDLSYSYTFNITPSTHFLGPYKNVNKEQFNYVPNTTNVAPTGGDPNTTERSVMDVTTLAEAVYLYSQNYTYAYKTFYYEYSDSSSNNQLCAVELNATGNARYAFTWFVTARSTDFTGGFINGTYASDGSWNGDPVMATDTTNTSFDCNGGGISRFNSDTNGTTGEGSYASNLSKTGSWIITDANQKQHTMRGTLTDWAEFILAHETRHYISYPTEEIHSTLCTGLGKYRSGTRWFTWKEGENHPVKTSLYIDYNHDQLLALDGYLTAYSDGTTRSDDERSIINDLFNTYFVTDSSNFENVVAAALLEKNAQIDNDSYYYVGIPTFNNTNKIYYRLVATQANSYDSNQKYYRISGSGHYDYLEVDSSQVNNSNYSSYYIVTATRVNDYYNYNDCYQMKDVDDYDSDYINNFFITNIYSSTTISSLKPFEYLHYYDRVYGGLRTVKDYLKSLYTTVDKNKLIAYCAEHQASYAKLLLLLNELNDVTETTIVYPNSIGNSDAQNSLSIDNLLYYSSLSVENRQATISGETFNYGYTFEYLNVSVENDDSKLRLYLASKSGTETVYYGVDNPSQLTDYVSVNTSGNVVDIPLNNNSNVWIYNANSNVLLYLVEGIKGGDYNVQTTMTYEVLPAQAGAIPGLRICSIPTQNQLNDYVSNEIFELDSTAQLISCVADTYTVITQDNNATGNLRYHRLVLDQDGSTSTGNDTTTLGTSPTTVANMSQYTFTGTMESSYLGKAFGLKVSTQSDRDFAYSNSMGNSNTIYRWNLYKIDLQLSVTYHVSNETRRVLIGDSLIVESSIRNVASTNNDYLVTVMKRSSGYSNRFKNLIYDATYNLLPIDYSKEQYINTLTSSVYYIDTNGVKSLASGEFNSAETYYTENDGIYSQASINETTYYQSMISNMYYVESGDNYVLATGAYSDSITYYIYSEGEYKETSSVRINLVDLLGINEIHHDQPSEYCIPELLAKLITTSNEAFLAFINNAVVTSVNNQSDYELLIRALISNVGYYPLEDAISKLNTLDSLSDEVKNVLAAAYLVTDYKTILKNQTSVYASFLRNYIDNSLSATYRYIQSDDSYDREKFEAFAQLIGYSLSTTGYGIYALASSYGIEDGRFIPDNLVLSSMNAYYNSSHEIVSTANAYWRKGSGATDEAVTDTTSVNYAFYEEMKQLKKSISTAIIELDLTDGTNTYMSNSNQTTKSNMEGSITYYITEAELANITSSLTISNVVIANRATLYLVNGSNESLYNSDSNKTINVTKNGNALTTTYQFKVVAEDTTVYSYYDIIFVIIPSTDTYTLAYSDDTTSKTYTYTGGTVNLKFTSEHLPANMDLTPYITISKTGSSYNYLENKELFETYFSYYTYGKYQVTDAHGDAKIKLEVFQALPYGTYTIKVEIGSVNASVTLIKNASTERNIVEFEFDNATVSLSGTAYASTVLFGRTFNKADLEVPAGTKGDIKPAYLSKFDISPNATYEASASYAYNNTTHLVIYTITYTITSESGDTKEYTHTITELAPYSASESFATEYMNGDTYSTNTSYTTTSADSNNVLSGDASINISFSRDLGTPEFRTYYNLSHFYIASGEFTIEDVSNIYSSIGSGSGVAAIGAPYAGITATITTSCDVGTYVFRYTYVSESTWGSDTLERKYIFPLIYITKEASIDSWISDISFLDGFLSEGSAATKLTYQNALVPNENTQENQSTYHYNSQEVYYQNYLNTQGITIDTGGELTYQNSVKNSNMNYYVLGNVSDASLSSYAPTMKINEYAEVYQYLTEEKANGTYGVGQTVDDTSLLNTNGATTIYLYLPYYLDTDTTLGESSLDTYEIFLVKMVVSAQGVKNLTEVYSASDGVYSEIDQAMVKNTPVHTFSGLTLDEIHSSDNSFTVSGNTYKISEFAGKPGNSSLYMNYIGNPEDGHFWYVSYAVFSESYLKSSTDKTHVDFYHISIIDLTNNIYYTIKVNVPTGFENDAIFMTINYVTYDSLGDPKENAVSIYAIVDSENSSVYIPQYELAMLPSGYYTFTLELAPGYKVSYTASRLNNINGSQAIYGENHEGAYFPPSSVVPIQIDLVFTVEVDQEAITTTNKWGMGTSSTETATATYKGAAATITQKQSSCDVNTNLVNLVSSSVRGTYVFKLNGTTVTKVASGENTYEYTFTPNDANYVVTTGTITVTGV